MSDIKDHPLRPAAEIQPEQAYLQGRLAQIEKGLGQLAARAGSPTTITQPLDTLDRARELASEMHKQVQVRPLGEAIAARLDWLDRVTARHAAGEGEPLPALDRTELDRRLLKDLLKGWTDRRG